MPADDATWAGQALRSLLARCVRALVAELEREAREMDRRLA